MVGRGRMEAVGLTPCSQGQEEAEKSWGQRYTFWAGRCTLQSEQFDRRQRRPAFFWRREHGERRLRKPTRAAVCRLVEEEETGACKGVRWEAAVLQGT